MTEGHGKARRQCKSRASSGGPTSADGCVDHRCTGVVHQGGDFASVIHVKSRRVDAQGLLRFPQLFQGREDAGRASVDLRDLRCRREHGEQCLGGAGDPAVIVSAAAGHGRAAKRDGAYSAGVDAMENLACGCRLANWLTNASAAVRFASQTTKVAPGCLVNCATCSQDARESDCAQTRLRAISKPMRPRPMKPSVRARRTCAGAAIAVRSQVWFGSPGATHFREAGSDHASGALLTRPWRRWCCLDDTGS